MHGSMNIKLINVRFADVEMSCCFVARMLPQWFTSPRTIYSLFRFHTSDWPNSLQPSNKIDQFPYPSHFISHMNLIHSP